MSAEPIWGDEILLNYSRVYAITPDHNSAIVKLADHGYAAMGTTKRDGAYINVADFAASHLKFDLDGYYKKVKDDSEIDEKIIENIKYTLEHAAGAYGTLHPGLRIDGLE